MPQNYWGMLPSLSGPLGLGQSSNHHGLVGGMPMKWREHKPTGTKILKLCRNSTGGSFIITETVVIIVVASNGDFCCFVIGHSI
jgi:hypothetical protein